MKATKITLYTVNDQECLYVHTDRSKLRRVKEPSACNCDECRGVEGSYPDDVESWCTGGVARALGVPERALSGRRKLTVTIEKDTTGTTKKRAKKAKKTRKAGKK